MPTIAHARFLAAKFFLHWMLPISSHTRSEALTNFQTEFFFAAIFTVFSMQAMSQSMTSIVLSLANE